jgi:hypothetical protein
MKDSKTQVPNLKHDQVVELNQQWDQLWFPQQAAA